jgi:hypothetical protein
VDRTQWIAMLTGAASAVAGCFSLFATLALADTQTRLQVFVSPTDCHGDCWHALRVAVQRCRQAGSTAGCDVVLAPGRYRVVCPSFAGPMPYIRTPGAVDLSNTTGVAFGAASPAAPAMLDIDYRLAPESLPIDPAACALPPGPINCGGCPAIAAHHATDVSLQNLIIDLARLPFSEGLVVSANTTSVKLRMKEPSHMRWNLTEYPWLRYFQQYVPPWGNTRWPSSSLLDITGYADAWWDASTGEATLLYDTPSELRPHNVGRTLFAKHFENMQAWGVYGWMVDGFDIRNTKLYTTAGMGFRFDFCTGAVHIAKSGVAPASGRRLSSTADGIHFM